MKEPEVLDLSSLSGHILLPYIVSDYLVAKYFIPSIDPSCLPLVPSSQSTPSQVPFVPCTPPIYRTVPYAPFTLIRSPALGIWVDMYGDREEGQGLCLQPPQFCKLNSTTFRSWLAEFTWEVCKSPGTSRNEYLTICVELPPDARPDEVRRFFESVGPIRECRVMKGAFIVFKCIIQGSFLLRKATVLLSMRPKRSIHVLFLRRPL
jgi:hypothetical protein